MAKEHSARITNVRWHWNPQLYPLLSFDWDGVPVTVYDEQKWIYLYGLDLAVTDHAGVSTVVKPTETKVDGVSDLEIVGGTRDPDVVRIVREFIDALDDGTFTERRFRSPT